MYENKKTNISYDTNKLYISLINTEKYIKRKVNFSKFCTVGNPGDRRKILGLS